MVVLSAMPSLVSSWWPVATVGGIWPPSSPACSRCQAHMVELPGMVTEPTGLTATSAAMVTPVVGSTADAVPRPPLIWPAMAPKPAPALPSAKSSPATSAACMASAR